MTSMNHVRGRGDGLRGNPSSLTYARDYRRSARAYSVALKERVGPMVVEYGIAWLDPGDADHTVNVLCRCNGGSWFDRETIDDAVAAVTEWEDIDNPDDPGRIELRAIPVRSGFGGTWGIEERDGVYMLVAFRAEGERAELPMQAAIAIERHSTAEDDVFAAVRCIKATAKRTPGIRNLAAAVRARVAATRMLPARG